MRTTSMAVLLAAAAAGPLAAQSHPAPATGHAIVAMAEGIDWQAAPASLPAGARIAVLEGDPSKPGPFTMRLWMPSGYRIPPHMHPSDERVTVISGIFHVGMGPTFERAGASALPAGTYAALGPGVAHFAWAEGETVIQLNNIGPWSLTYVNAADDPRTRK